MNKLLGLFLDDRRHCFISGQKVRNVDKELLNLILENDFARK